MKQEIIDTYSQNFTSAQDIYKKLNKKYTLQQIKDVLKNIDTNQIIGKKQENKHLSIPISAPLGSFQADLTFYDQFKRQNHGYSVLLTVIEINTRFAYVYPLKNKKAESILECLQNLLDKEKDNFKSISFDAGSEFENKLVKNFLEKNKIRYIFFNKQTNPNATMLIERFNRTIREKISKYQLFYKQKNYVDELPKLVSQYNNTEHSEIKMTPQKAKDIHFSNDQARQQKLDINQQINEDLQIGDFVRILRDKKLFEKGQKNYTKNVYKIINKENNNFILRKYKDGKLLDKEVKKTAQYLVKINIFDLIQNIKQRKEISKKEVKKQTNIQKRLKREGITLKNIIEYEKYLDDFQPTNEQPTNEQLLKQKYINQIKNHLKSEKLNWKSLNKPEDKKKIFQEFQNLEYDKALNFVHSNEKYYNQFLNLSQDKLVNFFQQKPDFKLSSRQGKQNLKYLQQIRDLLKIYYQEQIKQEQDDDEQKQSQDESEQNQNESQDESNEESEEESEEEIDEQKHKKKYKNKGVQLKKIEQENESNQNIYSYFRKIGGNKK